MSVWKVILATLVIFSTGAITGTLVSRKCPGVAPSAVSSPSGNQPGPQARPDFRMRRDFMRRFGEQLELTAEQTAKIESILCASQERTRKLWEAVSPQMHEEFKATQAEIREVLTPEQREKFEALMQEKRRARDRDRNGKEPSPQSPSGAQIQPPPKEPCCKAPLCKGLA